VGRAGFEVVGFETTEPPEQRVAVMSGLMRVESEIGRLKGEARDRDTSEIPLTSARAVEDYKTLLTARLPGQTLAEAAESLTAFHRAT